MALIPAMQIHLLDCKSTNSLISSLGSNRLQLCMIVLEHLRQTYWSANVMYRLFQGAHDVLKQSAPVTRRSSVGPTRPAGEGEDDTGMDMTLEPEASTELADEMTSFWFDPSASGLDQLLSPGFSLYDDRFQDFVAMYPLT
ncbi:hypothetical protein VHEMI03077 [[Torrubiella] hemipterigena]|uniref:Transcription factor domain-containing protein n=1 Tax=[Torrubiella] hemipterigena TaxID=1531966 RepID=A0A0A1TA19_9HYPO|nr:hypothetical protein VHEMI03077 [[Torrubiella] hemipterigena]